jgi:phosphoribosylanthranilate isomerase
MRKAVKVKICGITNAADALLAEAFGADVIGFIFAQSPRRITPAMAGKISDKLSPLTFKSGIFVNESPKTINKAAAEAGLDFAQLSGEETPEQISRIRGVRIIKVIQARDRAFVLKQAKIYEKCADILLFDTYHEELKGGTGLTFDWTVLDGIKKPFFIAGGINPKNIAKLLGSFVPYGIDVSSGVEAGKGKKDPEKLKRLFEELHKFNCA